MLSIIVPAIVTISNIFALLPIKSLIDNKRYYGAALTGCAAIASIFMHATETKHNLPGLFLAKYSGLFLNIDRVLAYMTGCYGIYLFLTNPEKTALQVLVPVLGAIGCGLGEYTGDLKLYCVCHVFWHFMAYYGLGLVNH
jgi:hypothetical protein